MSDFSWFSRRRVNVLPCSVGDRSMEAACGACLSIGRTLYSLGTDLLLYQSLLADNQEYQTSAGPVCWECKAILFKIQRFKIRARLAEGFLRNSQFNPVLVCSPKHSLSTLSVHTPTNSIFIYKFKVKHDDDDHQTLPSPGTPGSHNEYLDDKTDFKVEVEIKKEPQEDCERSPRVRRKTRGQKVKHKKEMLKVRKNPVKTKTEKETKCYQRKTSIKTKKEMRARFKTLRMKEGDMLKGRDEDRRKSFYVKATFKCETCIYGYYREKPYLDHLAEKHSEEAGDHQCPVCTARFSKAKLMESHRCKHYRLYRCRACGFQHRDVKHMLRHYETQHEIDKKFPCGDCDQVFPRYYALRYHRESCHRDSTECEHCGKVLSSRTNYRRHLMLHTGMPSRECPVCHKTFRGDELFKSHLRVHETEKHPDAYCAECDIHFKHMYIYRQHLKYNLKHITPDLLKYPCTLCERRFRQQGHLKRHFDAVHLKKTKFVCPHCDKNICSKGALRTHIRTVHDKIPVKKDKQCDICARTFATKATLQNHVRTHTGERPFHCNICGATFGHSSALWTHNKLVHLKLKKTDKVTAKQAKIDSRETVEQPSDTTSSKYLTL